MMHFTQRKLKIGLSIFFLFLISIYFGVFTHLWEIDFENEFHYPYDGDIEEFVQDLRRNISPKVEPINRYYFKYTKSSNLKCKGVESLRLTYLIKSAPENFHRRSVIRKTWGYERRFSDVEIRTVFLVGIRPDLKLQLYLNEESHKFQDIVQANFTDTYFNNTLKSMMGFNWAVKYCANSKFYMFVDDDYYVSTKNVLRFVRNPVNYQEYVKDFAKPVKSRGLKQYDIDLDDSARLLAGYAFKSSPHRHRSSKWYISLEEYPYDSWPTYITAGAYILSREALLDMYYASFYTKHFRFDDVYLGLLALKTKIEPFHSEDFHFYELSYNPKIYRFVIASHGYSNMEELLHVWTEQKSLGNA